MTPNEKMVSGECQTETAQEQASEKLLEEEVVELLLAQHMTVTTAESCTGGLIADSCQCGGGFGCFK